MCKVIAIASQKGGTAKSTTCRNLATALKNMGYKVLVVDCDNQANLTDCFGIESPDKLDITLYHLMEKIIMDEDLPEKEAYIINKEEIDILPASILLSDIEIKLVSAMSREYILKTIIDEIKGDYDFVLLDAMPSLGLMTLNVLASCDSVLIPATPEYLSAKGLELLLKTIYKIKKRINKSIGFEGILLTMFDDRTKLAQQMLEMIKTSYDSHIRVFHTKIPKSVKVGEANARSKSIIDYMPTNKAAIAYDIFAKELLNKELV
ncbi:ParA family protein [Maledivibacter halophilus]|uniref:Sporulation initiation inhibitor protein Soj n=1 Tax=Maledivibacter halophilus TaxID=36842 RepID=A0A1T5LPH7_9FIRM|nr:ParA family protein [Maledivibacter halophilus]SKC77866.1 chromosome partitioning protein [Maledivibacter halophilus]